MIASFGCAAFCSNGLCCEQYGAVIQQATEDVAGEFIGTEKS